MVTLTSFSQFIFKTAAKAPNIDTALWRHTRIRLTKPFTKEEEISVLLFTQLKTHKMQTECKSKLISNYRSQKCIFEERDELTLKKSWMFLILAKEAQEYLAVPAF